jgi:hypothetical protein
MRIAMLAGALAAALAASIPAAADSLILTYHGAPDRSGRYVMPGLTYERARGLRPALTFNAAYRGEVYAPVLASRQRSGCASLYLDAMVMRGAHPRHEVFALSLADGSVEPGWPVDVATALDGSFDPMTQNQRSALALSGGRVLVPYSGLAGDCGVYAYRGDTGALLAPPQPLLGTTNFQTLIAADGRLFVTGGGKVYAFTF